MTNRPLCAREECDNELRTGKVYCSTQCANIARSEKIAERKQKDNEIMAKVEVARSEAIPADLEDLLVGRYGHSRTALVFAEMERQWEQDRSRGGVRLQQGGIYGVDYGAYPYGYPMGDAPDMPRRSKKPPTDSPIEPYTPLLKRAGGYLTDTRRDSKIPYSDIDRMLSLGPCLLASRLKQGPILRTLASPRKWKVRSSDAKLAQIAQADLQRFFMLHGRDMLTSLPYGAAFGSLSWRRVRADELGDFDGIGKSSMWWAIDRADWAHPSTVSEILRHEKTMRFAGFAHKRSVASKDAIVTPPGALLITHDKRFGDMWGTSIFNAGYDFAVWYERVMIAFLRFLDEDANKKIMVKGPSNGSTTVMGQKIRNADYALMLAENVRRTGHFTIPSERDINTGEPLWEVEYLKSDQIGTQFIDALRYLSAEILRAAVIGDSSATQNAEFGSRANSTVHQQTTQIDNHLAFMDIIGHVNEHVSPRYGMFNRNYNSPPAVVVEAEVLDSVEQGTLMNLIATAGNIKLGDGTPADIIDWEAVLRGVQIPTLTEAQREEQLNKFVQDAKKKAKAFGLKPGQPVGGDPEQQPPGAQKADDEDRQPPSDEAQQQEEKAARAMLSGELPGIVMTDEMVARAVAKGAFGPGDIV